MKTEEKFFWGAIVGSAIGAAAALLFTPLAGKILRKKIINGLYQPLSIPKIKIFKTKRRRLAPKARISSRLDGNQKVAKKRAQKNTKKD